MQFFYLLSVLVFAAIPLYVTACEFVCQTGTCNAVLANYEKAVEETASAIAEDIETLALLPSSKSALQTQIMDGYKKHSFYALNETVFPGFFHGKCQNPATGIDPAGCPNPDCPVVCGTPGSMVHFYSKFRELAYNATSASLLHAVKDIKSDSDRSRRSLTSVQDAPELIKSEHWASVEKRIPVTLMASCGGSLLAYCDKEAAMKKLILTFP